MKRFRFELERLARVRRIQEEVERARWLEAEARARDAEGALERLDHLRGGVQRELADAQAAATLAVPELLCGQRELARLVELRRRGEERVRTLRFQAERQRAPWIERRREVGALERLEERRRRAWRAESEREQALALDEVALERAFRRDPAQELPEPGTAPEPSLKGSARARRSPHQDPSDPPVR